MPGEYVPTEAARVAHAALPPPLRAVLTLEDVLLILYLEFQYYEAAARNPPHSAPPNDLELLVAFVSGEAVRHGRSYSAEQIAHVLKGEDQYLRSLGLLDSQR